MLIEAKTRITAQRPPSAGARVAPGAAPVLAWRAQSGIGLMLDNAKLARFVDQCWGDAIVPTLVEYIKIPNKSPAFDPDWAAHGHMEEAVLLFERWARERRAAVAGGAAGGGRAAGRPP